MQILNQNADPRACFKEFIYSKGMFLTKIAQKANVSQSHLFRIIDGERPLTEELRKKLNAILETNY